MRDSYASYVGHPPLLEYMTLAMGETSREEMRVKLIEKMVRPVGAPPEVCGLLFFLVYTRSLDRDGNAHIWLLVSGLGLNTWRQRRGYRKRFNSVACTLIRVIRLLTKLKSVPEHAIRDRHLCAL